MPLELDSLRKAVSALNGVLAKSDDAEFMRGLDEVAQNAIKSGVIQHFEFTYELC
ncbi:MAG TPA: nucleotidyltransferase substrate binding protein [Phycisphaerae bacterium]|nr:nucleotidyltransferase substrate binding protein [Phycisphaerae bacterium]